MINAAWSTYQDAWDEINTRILSNEVRPYLTFATIPWPVLRLSSDPQLKESNEITLEDTREFLLSHFHSPEKTREGRLRDARIRWSTSRSPSWLAFVVAADRERVREGIEQVNWCLNNL
ncbi:hypothetical protein CPB86DRAFT_716791 [Serendipita vermifera]|nr:hypothetical protein CPB86DRAFT_716791 [Serendipita vermifera]